jgi:hypothetical protein
LKTLLVTVVIVAVVVGLVFLIRSRIAPTHSTTVADIPPIFTKLATLKDGSFAVFMFDSPLSRGGEAVNLQYSVEHGTVGSIGSCSAARTSQTKKRLMHSPHSWGTRCQSAS